jgi:hypothetical protein
MRVGRMKRAVRRCVDLMGRLKVVQVEKNEFEEGERLLFERRDERRGLKT